MTSVIQQATAAGSAPHGDRWAALNGLVLAIWLALASTPCEGQAPAEKITFDAAVRTQRSGFSAQAADEFSAFVKASPESPLAPEATLLEAGARRDLGQLDAAARLLEDRHDKLGVLRDQALHLRGEIHLRRGDFAAAAATFHQLISDFPESPLLLKAGFGEALALFRASRFSDAAALLAGPTNAFARAVKTLPNDELVVGGNLLLAEAQLRSGDAAAAQASLDKLTHRPLTPNQSWERQFLVTSLMLTNRQESAALVAASNLLVLAVNTASRDYLARTHAMRGVVLRGAGRDTEAFIALTNNLAESAPPEWRRDALLAIAEIPLAPALVEPAIQLLTPLANGTNPGPAYLAARLAVAELRLQQHFGTNTPPASNHLAEARLLITGVLSNNPAPPLAGRAWYDLGWIGIAMQQLPAATEAFSRASTLLTPSPLQAFALFKLADCEMQATNRAASVAHYLRVVREYGDNPSIRRGILERALYQGALAALDAGQQSLAGELAGRAILEFPEGQFRDDTRVLYGQTLARLDPPGLAREVLQRLASRLTNSPALPEIRLTVARSYFSEGSWSNAYQHLDDWTRSYPNHPSISRAEFEKAWAAFRTGDDTQAHGLFTNFLARFPDHPSAPQAQMWVGNNLFRLGQFAPAEAAYQLIFQRTNWPVSGLTYEARILAGRAAFARQGYKDAKPYFHWLIANGPPAVTNSLVPPELVARAYFALGDCFLLDPEQRDDKLVDAMNAYRRVIDGFPNLREAVLARGRLANCHLVRAGLDPAQATDSYTNASQLYLEVLTPVAGADIATRSEAEIGLAAVLEKRAGIAPAGAEKSELLKQSLARLLRVFHAGNLNPGENTSPFWLNRAGTEAARLAEIMGLRDQAAGLYDTLAKTFPDAAAPFLQRAAQLRAPR